MPDPTVATDASVVSTPPAHDVAARRGVCTSGVSLAILAVAALAVSWTAAFHHSERLSPVDEKAYADSLAGFPGDLWVVRAGHTVLDDATPTFIGSTWLLSRVFVALGMADELTAGRLTGGIWLAAGVCLLFVVLRRLGLVTPLAFGLSLVYVGSPAAWWSSTFISSDAPALLFGSLLLLMAYLGRTGVRSMWWLVPVAVVATLIKATNLVAVVAAVIVVVVHAFVAASSPERRGMLRGRGWPLDVRIAAIAAAAALATQAVWMAVRAGLPVVSSSRAPAVDFGPAEMLAQSTNFLTNTLTWNVYDPLPLFRVPVMLATPLTWGLILAVVGSLVAFRVRRSPTGRALWLAALWAAFLAAPALALAVRLWQGDYASLPGRYGICLVPVLFAFVGALGVGRRTGWAITGYAVVLAGWAFSFSIFVSVI